MEASTTDVLDFPWSLAARPNSFTTAGRRRNVWTILRFFDLEGIRGAAVVSLSYCPVNEKNLKTKPFL